MAARQVDRLVNAFRRAIEEWLPWFDRAEEQREDARIDARVERADMAEQKTNQRLADMRASWRATDARLGRR